MEWLRWQRQACCGCGRVKPAFPGLELFPFERGRTAVLAAPLPVGPAAQVVLVGGDEPHYGSKPPGGGTWMEAAMSLSAR